MRIYNEIVFDVDGKVIYEDSFEYSGELMLCQDIPEDIPDMNNDGIINIQDIVAYSNQQREAGADVAETKATLTNMSQDITSGAAQERQKQLMLSMQEQARDAQTRPLPSLPSISGMGSVASTGVINWNAIPGGFQPLPQIAGGRNRKKYQLSKFHGGVNQRSSPRDISDAECQEAENVTFSQIGAIKILGDLKSSTSTGLTAYTYASTTGQGQPSAGYGLFILKSGYSLADPPVAGEYTIIATQDGDDTRLSDGSSSGTFGSSSAHDDVAPVYYAAGNRIYACDANWVDHPASNAGRRSSGVVYREDINGTFINASTGANDSIVRGWKAGLALIGSPTRAASNASNSVTLMAAQHNASNAGEMAVQIVDNGNGSWSAANYFFYVSWIFDNGTETGLTSLGSDDGFENNSLEFNVSIQHTDAAPLGGDKRIEGARIYFKETGTAERWLLAEISLIDGVRGALDTTFIPWDAAAAPVYDLAADIIFEAPPSVHSYTSQNGYGASEVYTKSPDAASDGAGPTAIDVRYKTAVVGPNGIVFIGNVRFNNKVFSDSMMFSVPSKPGVFPQLNFIDSPSSDGSSIMALASFRDVILQFRENSMYVINISNLPSWNVQASFRDCGVSNPCQVFTTAFGVIFANKHGCFIYDGRKVISLTSGKFNTSNWGLTENSSISDDAASVPSVGYDPRSQSIIVLKNIGHDATSDDEEAWIYNMITQSWVEGTSFINNAVNDVQTNFQISPNGYLCLIQFDAANPVETPYTYDVGQSSGNAQTITYITKDIDFGFPTQTKKIFAIYITYKGNADALTLTYGADGDTSPTEAMTNSETGDGTMTDAGVGDYNVATYGLTSHPSNLHSLSLKFTGAVGEDFELNDITIEYRLRPRS